MRSRDPPPEEDGQGHSPASLADETGEMSKV